MHTNYQVPKLKPGGPKGSDQLCAGNAEKAPDISSGAPSSVIARFNALKNN